MPRPKGSADLLENHRWRALALLDPGLSLDEVAPGIGSSASSVVRWRDAQRGGGRKALKISRKFGVRCHRDHEEKIKRWKRDVWPRVKKNAVRLGARIVFADDSGFLRIPWVGRTWAPQGQTPVYRHRQRRRERISVIWNFAPSQTTPSETLLSPLL